MSPDSDMKSRVLSIRQPWAWLIVNGHKLVENRPRRSRYRGPLLIHTGQRFDQQGYEWVQQNPRVEMPDRMDFDTGGIVGRVIMEDCVAEHHSPWFVGPYGYVFTEPEVLPFFECRGQLGIFSIAWPPPLHE